MKKLIAFLCIVAALNSCDQTTSELSETSEIEVIPTPKQVASTGRLLLLSDESKILACDEHLIPLADLVSEELKTLFDISLHTTQESNKYADLILGLDGTLDDDEYTIEIQREVVLKGGSYQALAMARSTLYQVAFVKDGTLAFPQMSIKDNPMLSTGD